VFLPERCARTSECLHDYQRSLALPSLVTE
jgi:hypothetical protein